MMTHATDRQHRKVCIGVIGGPHGVRGEVRLKSFTDAPEDVAAYGPLSDAAGERRFRIRLTGTSRNMLTARIDGVADRTAAEALRGVELFVARDRLPETEEDEFYHADLIGLPVRLADGTPFGTVRAIYDHGAGDVIEIGTPDGGTEVLLFNKAVVPEVDLGNGFVVVDPPAESDARADDEDAAEAAREAGR